jgi:hypothetical protein
VSIAIERIRVKFERGASRFSWPLSNPSGGPPLHDNEVVSDVGSVFPLQSKESLMADEKGECWRSFLVLRGGEGSECASCVLVCQIPSRSQPLV